MKVILLRDVAGVGQKGSVKEVSDGYALNMLLPRKFAEAATPEKLAAHAHAQASAKAAHDAEESAGKALTKKLAGMTVTLNAPGNEQGHLYQKVSAEALSAVLALQTGIVVAAKDLHPKMPIKQAGEWPVEVRVGGSNATFVVAVVVS